ncbi:CBO0543 family protein [Bacillus sp. SCS-153A]|uniref:CBO0543 family protein n=1 Tax=Rossellomorea sedimentorum TaxID=3115294 RepID=UPI0039062C2C
MKKKRTAASVAFLYMTTLAGIILLPFAIVKRSFKDWLIVYLVGVLGNSLADRYLVSKGYLRYNIRPYKDTFKIHLPFDYIHYPLMLLYYNQWTLNSKPAGLFFKLFPFLIPQVLLETFAERKTKLISWRKGWTWYHSLISLVIKLLLCRGIIALIRIINDESISVKKTPFNEDPLQDGQ